MVELEETAVRVEALPIRVREGRRQPMDVIDDVGNDGGLVEMQADAGW